MNYFDTHAHLGLISNNPIEQMIVAQEAKRDGVRAIISVCNNLYDFSTTYKNLSLASNVYHAVGLSPNEAHKNHSHWQEELVKALALPKVVAIGETGLDYTKKSSQKEQIELFISHLELANRYNLPVIIHNREAGADILEILKDIMPHKGVVFHCFSENIAFANKVSALHNKVFISFAGNLTYRNAKNLQESAYHIPLERILVETESPFMIPHEYRERKRTHPSFIHSTVDALAQLRDQELNYVAETLYNNACIFFNLNSK